MHARVGKRVVAITRDDFWNKEYEVMCSLRYNRQGECCNFRRKGRLEYMVALPLDLMTLFSRLYLDSISILVFV